MDSCRKDEKNFTTPKSSRSGLAVGMSEIQKTNKMNMRIKKLLVIAFFIIGAQSSFAQSNVVVGGEVMYPKKNIIENAINSKDHTTLVAAVKAADLVATLQGDGPFTVFAPTNAAFEKLPEGTVANLVKPENKKTVTSILTYHVVSGKMDSASLLKAIKKGKGEASLTTVNGGTLIAKMNGKRNVTLTDENGNTSNISLYDVYQSNGVIHVIDTVVLPK